MPTFFSLLRKKREVCIQIDSQGQAIVELPEYAVPILIGSASATGFGVILQLKRVDGLPKSIGTTLWCPPWHSQLLALRRWVVWLSRSPVEA